MARTQLVIHICHRRLYGTPSIYWTVYSVVCTYLSAFFCLVLVVLLGPFPDCLRPLGSFLWLPDLPERLLCFLLACLDAPAFRPPTFLWPPAFFWPPDFFRPPAFRWPAVSLPFLVPDAVCCFCLPPPPTWLWPADCCWPWLPDCCWPGPSELSCWSWPPAPPCFLPWLPPDPLAWPPWPPCPPSCWPWPPDPPVCWPWPPDPPCCWPLSCRLRLFSILCRTASGIVPSAADGDPVVFCSSVSCASQAKNIFGLLEKITIKRWNKATIFIIIKYLNLNNKRKIRPNYPKILFLMFCWCLPFTGGAVPLLCTVRRIFSLAIWSSLLLALATQLSLTPVQYSLLDSLRNCSSCCCWDACCLFYFICKSGIENIFLSFL